MLTTFICRHLKRHEDVLEDDIEWSINLGRLTQIAIELAAYRKKHNRFPETLDELRQFSKVAPEVIVDCLGNDWLYQSDGKTFTVGKQRSAKRAELFLPKVSWPEGKHLEQPDSLSTPPP